MVEDVDRRMIKEKLRQKGFPTTWDEIKFCFVYYFKKPFHDLKELPRFVFRLKTWVWTSMFVLIYAFWTKQDYTKYMFILFLVLSFLDEVSKGYWRHEYKEKFILRK